MKPIFAVLLLTVPVLANAAEQAPADAGVADASVPDASTDADSEKPPLPDYIIGKRGYYSVSSGYLQLPMPTGMAHFVKIDVNYLYVDQGLAHLYQIHLGMGGKSQVLAVGYGLGLGPRKGDIHLGLKANLGYAHLYQEDEDKHVHGLYLGLNPMVMGTLWKNWQFFLEAGWSFIPLASEAIPNGRGYTGWNVGVGVGTSLD